MYKPAWVAWGYQVNVPLFGLKLALGGMPAIDNATDSPAGSLAEMVNDTAFPGRTICRPGTVTTGACGVSVTVSCTVTPLKLALILML
jgi:hypothetical protein